MVEQAFLEFNLNVNRTAAT